MLPTQYHIKKKSNNLLYIFLGLFILLLLGICGHYEALSLGIKLLYK
jgi:hypothetical protein